MRNGDFFCDISVLSLSNLYQIRKISVLCAISMKAVIYADVCDFSGPYHSDRPAGQREGGYVHLDCCS